MAASKTVVQRQGKEIVVSLPDGIIEYARDVQHAEKMHSQWIGPAVDGRVSRIAAIEWQGFDAVTEPNV